MSFDDIAYWKKRMLEQLNSNWKSWTRDTLAKVKENAFHIKLEDKEINVALNKITDGFTELEVAIVKAKIRKDKKSV